MLPMNLAWMSLLTKGLVIVLKPGGYLHLVAVTLWFTFGFNQQSTVHIVTCVLYGYKAIEIHVSLIVIFIHFHSSPPPHTTSHQEVLLPWSEKCSFFSSHVNFKNDFNRSSYFNMIYCNHWKGISLAAFYFWNYKHFQWFSISFSHIFYYFYCHWVPFWHIFLRSFESASFSLWRTQKGEHKSRPILSYFTSWLFFFFFCVVYEKRMQNIKRK